MKTLFNIFILAIFTLLLLISSGYSENKNLIKPIISIESDTVIRFVVDSTTLFPNPERGWAHSINPDKNNPAPDLQLSDLKNWCSGSDHLTLVRKYYFIKEYGDSGSLIAQSFLDKFQFDLDVCRAAGVKLIPRFNYIWEPGSTNHDPPLAIIIKHIQQLKPYFQKNWDVIAFLEAGFVGAYGEWNKSFQNYIDNYSLEVKPDGITVRDSLLSALPVSRFLVMRYMNWHKLLIWPTPLTKVQAYSPLTQARIGYHHDYIMQGPHWDAPGCGICPDYKTMHDYYVEDTKWVPSTGEPCSGGRGSTYYQTNDPRPQLRAIHQSTLINNSCIDYSFWKSKPWYDGLTRDLGYRFWLTNASFKSEIKHGSLFTLKLNLTNGGYAAPFNERRFEIILRNQKTGEKLVTDVTSCEEYLTNPRYWQPGRYEINLNIFIPKNIDTGTYDLLLNLPDPAPLLYSRPEYSIRLANQNIWEQITGYNLLFKGLRIL